MGMPNEKLLFVGVSICEEPSKAGKHPSYPAGACRFGRRPKQLSTQTEVEDERILDSSGGKVRFASNLWQCKSMLRLLSTDLPGRLSSCESQCSNTCMPLVGVRVKLKASDI